MSGNSYELYTELTMDIYSNLIEPPLFTPPTKNVVIDIQTGECLVEELKGEVNLPDEDFTPIYYNTANPFTLVWDEYK